MPENDKEVEPEREEDRDPLPPNLELVPRYGDGTLNAAPWVVLITTGLFLAGVVTLYYLRSSTALATPAPEPSSSAGAPQAAVPTPLGAGEVARTATDFAVVLLVSGALIVLIGIFLALGEVVKVQTKQQPAGTSEASAAQRRQLGADGVTELLSKTLEALVNAARRLSVGRLVIITGVVPIVLSAWVAQSATTVTLTSPDPAPVVSETPAAPPDDPSGGEPTDDPSAAPSDTGAAASPEPTDITTP